MTAKTKTPSKSKAGPGGTFEQAIQATCDAYASANIAFVKKSDPPTKVIRPPGRRPLVIQLENPYLDFTGAWLEQGGRMITVEAKNNEKPSLPVGDKITDGISTSQLMNAAIWEAAGAAVLFLWQREGQVRYLTVRMVREATADRKSVPWAAAKPVPQGEGFILIDFLAILRDL